MALDREATVALLGRLGFWLVSCAWPDRSLTEAAVAGLDMMTMRILVAAPVILVFGFYGGTSLFAARQQWRAGRLPLAASLLVASALYLTATGATGVLAVGGDSDSAWFVISVCMILVFLNRAASQRREGRRETRRAEPAVPRPLGRRKGALSAVIELGNAADSPDDSVQRYHLGWFTRWVGGAIALLSPPLISLTPHLPSDLDGWVATGALTVLGLAGAWAIAFWVLLEVGPGYVLIRNLTSTRFSRRLIRSVSPSYQGLQFRLEDGRMLYAMAVSRSVYAQVLGIHRRSLPIVARLDPTGSE